MPTIKYTIILTLMFGIQSCHKKQLIINAGYSPYDGILTLSLQSEKDSLLLVCFVEINDNKINGLSCQNGTGFHLFSGGIKNNQFFIEKVSSFILKIKPQMILNYIKISLYSDYEINNKLKNKILVSKELKKTVIKDIQHHRTVEIKIL